MNFQASQDAFARAVTDPESPLPDGIPLARGEPDSTPLRGYPTHVEGRGGVTQAVRRGPIAATPVA